MFRLIWLVVHVSHCRSPLKTFVHEYENFSYHSRKTAVVAMIFLYIFSFGANNVE